MKKKLIISYLIVGSLISIIFSCNKQDVNTSGKALDDFKESIKDKGYQTVAYINQKGFTFSYTDKEGNDVLMNTTDASKRQNGLLDECGINCNDTDDPGDLQPEATLLSCTREFDCGSAAQTSTLTVTWELSLPYTILQESPINSALKSRGRIRFKDSGGTVIYSNTNITPLIITNLGTDPNCSSHTRFRVTYTLEDVDNDYFSSGNTLENGMFFYHDCEVASYNNTINYQTIYAWNLPGPASSPCTRTDKVWISVGSGAGGRVQVLGVGNTIGCTNPMGWVHPNVQYMEYWKDSAPGTVYTASIGILDVYTLPETTPGTGAWTIRYRNEKTTSPACAGPWFYDYFSN